MNHGKLNAKLFVGDSDRERGAMVQELPNSSVKIHAVLDILVI